MSDSDAAGIRRHPIMVATIAIAAAAILATGLATSRSVAAGLEAAPPPQATGYLPSISDLMIATIQPRHERLWRAAQDGHWEFAAYELGNLHGAFDRLGLARNPCTDPGVRVGFKRRQQVPELRLAMPELHLGAIRETF